jgi:hypothetical protein
MIAWFEMRPVTDESTFTRNATVLVSPIAIVPPVVLLAPVPRRTRTVRDAAMYSP